MFTGLVIKRIRYAFELLKGIVKGDLTRDIVGADNDETGQMMSLLGETQRSISALIATVDGKALSIREVGAELSAMMSQSAASARQISVNTHDMKDKTLTQATEVNQTNAVMGQIVQNIQSINQRIAVQLNR
ncbi:MAG: hypothetical protein LBK73_02150 [Treponema sp.]|nr:hypothetical protein [Treponema sp.]